MQTCGGGSSPQHLKGQAWAFSTKEQSLRGRPWRRPGEGPQLLHQPETLTPATRAGVEGQGLRAGRYDSLNVLSHLLWWTREAQCSWGPGGGRGRVVTEDFLEAAALGPKS